MLNVNHFQGLGTSAGTLSLSSGVTLNNTSGAAVTVGNPKSMSLGGSLTFTGTNNLNLGSGATTLGSALSIDVVAGTLGFNGEIGGAFGLTKSGAGTLQLSGLSGTSSYTGDTTINGGTLELAGTSRFRSGTTINLNTGGTLLVGASASYEGATLVLSGGTLSLQSVVVGDVSYNANSTLSASNANLNGVQTIRSGVTVTMAGDLLGTIPTTATAGRIVIENTGTLRVTSTATFDMKKGIQLGTATGTAAGSATLSSDASVQLFLPASITGDAALVKTGAGNIRLIGDNSYRGGTVINAGIIGIFSDGSLGLAGTSLKLNNGTIVGASPDTSRSDSGDKTATIGTARSLTLGVGTSNNMDAQTGRTLVYGGVIAEDGAGSAANLRFGNTGTRDGTVILSGANTYSGSSTLVAGTLEVATLANGGVASGIGDASNAASNLVLNAGTLRYSGVSASTDRLFTLGGSATLDTGSGTLAFTNAGSLGSSGSSARTLSLAGSGSGSLAAIVANPDVSFATSLTKTGSGTWALSGINTYTGATNVQNGTLAFSTASALNSSSGLNLGVAATSSATLRYTGGAGTLTPDITILGNGSDTIQNSGTGMLTLTGGLIKNGNALKLDGGTAGLTVMGSITGVVTNLATVGKVSLGAALPEGSALVVGDGSANSTQVVLGTSGSALNLTVSGLSSSGSNNAIVGGNAAAVSTLEVAVASSETTDSFDGVLGGATAESKNLGLKKSGAGTLVLSGSEANTFVGDTVVTGGVLKIQKSNNTVAIPAALTVTSGTVQILASGQLASTSDIVVGASGTFNFGSASGLSNTFGTFTNSGTFTSGANTFTGTGNSVYLSSGVYTISAGGTVSDAHWNVTGGTNTVEGGASRGTLEVLSGSNGLEFDGTASPTITLNSDAAQAGRMLLSGNVSVLSGLTSGTATIASGGSALNPGSVDLNGGTRTVTVSNGSAATDLLISAAITNGGLTKEGLGTLTLSGVNSYDGVMAINAGVVDLQNTAALGSATSGTSVASGASLQVRGGIALGAEALTLDGSGFSSGGALRNISGDNSASGSVTLGGATRINVDAGSLSLSGALSGAYALSVGGPGRLKLTGASNGSTTTDVDGGATLQVGDGGTTGVLGSSNVTIGSGSTVEFKWLSGTMVTVGNVIGGAGSVVANGGDLSLGGAISYSGMTRVSSGRLEVSGTGQLSGTSSVDIAGGTFLLSGTASDRVNNSAAVSLGGGSGGISKFETSGSVAETLGALTLVGGGGIRVIDFGSGSGSLTFSSLASSGAGVPLQIWNWSGNAWTGGGTDRLIITSGQLGANTNLSDITIFSDSGTTTVRTGEVAWGAGGELVAIPEARSVLGALMLLMPLAWRERRQWWRGAAARMRG